MSYDFPFTLRDVAELCGIPTSTTKDNEYVTCPFCGKKKKMNIIVLLVEPVDICFHYMQSSMVWNMPKIQKSHLQLKND